MELTPLPRPEHPDPYTVLDRRFVYDSPWIRIREDRFRHRRGAEGRYAVCSFRRTAFGVLALGGPGGRDAPHSPSNKSFVFSGPLCTSLDVLHPSAKLPMPQRGDLLAFENAGAYGYTESMPLFLSHEWPAEVGVRKGRLALLRRPPRVAELQARQKTPF